MIKRNFHAALNKRGSLLLEALLSVIILSVSITMIIQSMTASLRAVKYSIHYTKASILMENKMVGLLQKGAAEPGAGESGDFDFPYENYQYSLSVEPSDAGTGDDHIKLSDVQLRVSWMAGGKEKGVSVGTYMPERIE